MTLAAVVTYRNPAMLKACVTSLTDQVTATHVIDNSENNRLYTDAVNEGILVALREGYEYVLVCCDDVTLRPGAVSAMERFLAANEDCAIAMPIQVSRTGEVTCGGCVDAFPYGRHINLPLTHEFYSEPQQSYWANGACFLLRTDAARECGLLDTNMKFICSDSDYSFTLRSRGWSIFLVPEAQVEHEPRGALATTNAFLEKRKDQDALYFIRKWLSGSLYQEMSYEGARLKAKDIEQQMTILSWRLAHGYEACEPKDSGGSDV